MLTTLIVFCLHSLELRTLHADQTLANKNRTTKTACRPNTSQQKSNYEYCMQTKHQPIKSYPVLSLSMQIIIYCFNSYNCSLLRGNIYRLHCNTQRLNTGLHFISSRVIDPWKSLPVIYVNSYCYVNSLNVFKQSLAKVDLSEFIYFSYRCPCQLLSVVILLVALIVC